MWKKWVFILAQANAASLLLLLSGFRKEELEDQINCERSSFIIEADNRDKQKTDADRKRNDWITRYANISWGI